MGSECECVCTEEEDGVKSASAGRRRDLCKVVVVYGSRLTKKLLHHCKGSKIATALSLIRTHLTES